MTLKKTIFTLVSLVGLVSLTACTRAQPETMPCVVSPPSTNNMTQAINWSGDFLVECPGKQTEVFLYLIDVGKRNPGLHNRSEILDLYDRLIQASLVDVKRANEMLTRYLYVRFTAVDRVNERFSSLSDRALDRLAREIDNELELKKIGLWEVSGSDEQYERAKDYAERMKDILESTKIQWNYMRAMSNP